MLYRYAPKYWHDNLERQRMFKPSNFPQTQNSNTYGRQPFKWKMSGFLRKLWMPTMCPCFDSSNFPAGYFRCRFYESTRRTAQMSVDNWTSPSNKLTVCYGNLFIPQLGCSPETISWTSLALKMWVRKIYNLLRLIRVNHYFPRCNTIFTRLHNLMVNPQFSDLPCPVKNRNIHYIPRLI